MASKVRPVPWPTQPGSVRPGKRPRGGDQRPDFGGPPVFTSHVCHKGVLMIENGGKKWGWINSGFQLIVAHLFPCGKDHLGGFPQWSHVKDLLISPHLRVAAKNRHKDADGLKSGYPWSIWIVDLAVVVQTVLGSHFGLGEFTTHFRTYFSGDWDVHWGYDLDFDSWPLAFGLALRPE